MIDYDLFKTRVSIIQAQSDCSVDLKADPKPNGTLEEKKKENEIEKKEKERDWPKYDHLQCRSILLSLSSNKLLSECWE